MTLDRLGRRAWALAAVAALAWRVDRVRCTAVAVLLALETASFAGYGLGLRAFFDSAVTRGDPSGALVAAAATAVSYALLSIGGQLRGNLVQQVDEKAGLAVDEEVLGITARLAGLEHLEQPAYLDRVDQLRGEGAWLVDSFFSTVISAGQALRLVVIVGLLSTVHPGLLALGGFAAVPLYLQRVGERRVRAATLATAEQRRVEERLTRLQTEPAPAQELRTSGSAGRVAGLAHALWTAAGRAESRAHLAAALLALAGWAVFIAGYVAALWVVALLVTRGQRTVGDLMMVLTLAFQLQSQVAIMLFTLRLAQKGRHVLDAYRWLRTYAGYRRPLGRLPAAPRLRHGITLSGVSFSYPGASTPALRDVDVHLPAGAVVALVGEHGSGKTTLAKLLCGFYEPTAGTITVDGTPLAAIAPASWHGGITAAFQDFARYDLTVREAVGIGDRTAMGDESRLHAALAQADATDVVARLPRGLDTVLGRRFGGVDLSEGQWQKLALARSYLPAGPTLAVLDEPTASLDAPSEAAVFARQMALARGIARRTGAVTLLVSHRFSTVVPAELILVLRDGQIVESGDHTTLSRAGGLYAELYRLQAAGYADGPTNADSIDADSIRSHHG